MAFDYKDAKLGDNLIDIEAGAKMLSDRAALFGSLYDEFRVIGDGGQKVYENNSQVLDDALLVAASFIAKHDTDKVKDKNLSFHAASNALAQAANLLLLTEQMTAIEQQVDEAARQMRVERKTARLFCHTIGAAKIIDLIKVVRDNTTNTLEVFMGRFVRRI